MRQTIKLLGLFLLFSAVGFGQDFSAEVFNSKSGAGDEAMAKIFVTGNKVRIEPAQEMNGVKYVIWDVTEHHYIVVVPDQHVYMDLGHPMMEQQTLAFWRPADVNNACADWEKLAVQFRANERLGSCHKVGTETVGGRSAVKYEGTSKAGKKGDIWVDAKLDILIKFAEADQVTEFRNIREESQPATLFEVPSGYQKMDMSGMMGRQPR